MTATRHATTRRPPKLRHHHKTGQGYVKLNGRFIYLGRFDKPETVQRYHQVIADWLAAGRQLPQPQDQITIMELAARHLDFAEQYYARDDGEPSKELGHVRPLLGLLKQTCGPNSAAFA